MIDQDYVKTGKVKIVFKNRAALGQGSVWGAEAALCAADQEKFWEYHDALYEAVYAGSGALLNSKANLKRLGADLGLDSAQFDACVDSGKYTSRVQEESQESQNRGVTGTPTFFINGTQIVGAQSYETFKAAIEAELAKP